MIYRKQAGFDEFHCIADQCPKSCCEGWQIVIDDESMDRYQSTTGPFADRLQAGINEDESCFRQSRMRCSMLSASGLCDLQTALGEEYLCDTCRQYPRHTEEFPDLREYSLSLSCPEVVRMILDPSYTFMLTESRDDACDDPEEFDDFDFLLFDKLSYAREKMFAVLADHSRSLQERITIIAAAALELQELFDQGELFSMDEVSYDGSQDTTGTGASLSFSYMRKSLDLLLDLEVLESSWTKSMQDVKDFWSKESGKLTAGCEQSSVLADADTRSTNSDAAGNTDLDLEQASAWNTVMNPDPETSFIFEKIFQSLLFTYFSGSVYDGEIYARTMIAAAGVRWLLMIHYAQPDVPLAEMIYLFSREVEHSDPNINELISFFEAEL